MQQNDIKRVLISVTDKKGIAEFAQGLQPFGVEILSTGGTAAQLRKSGVPVTDVSDYTGFPEMMDGRLKTLHPKIIEEMKETEGKISEATNFELAKKTFQLTARYDGAISNYLGLLSAGSPEKRAFPDTFSCQFAKAQDLRYGENPHQTLN